MARRRVVPLRQEVAVPTHTEADLAFRTAGDPATDTRRSKLLEYRNQDNAKALAANREFLVGLVLRTDFTNHKQDRDLLRLCVEFVAWATGVGKTVDTELFNDRAIDEWASAYGHSAGDYASRVRRIVKVLTGDHGRRQTHPRRPAVGPHSVHERTAFFAALPTALLDRLPLDKSSGAREQREADLWRNVTVVLVLAFHCGFQTETINNATEGWLARTTHELRIHDPQRDWEFRVPDRWRPIFEAGLTGASDSPLLGTSDRQAHVTVDRLMERAREKDARLRGFTVAKAAARWRTDVLTRADFAVVARLCGFRPGQKAPADLLEFVPVPPLGEMRTVAARIAP